MTMTLCVLLWAHEGRERDLVAYEDRVLALIPEHGGTVLQRARTDGQDGKPLEIHVIRLPSADAMETYMVDPRRTALAADRDRAIARTDVMQVDLVGDPPPTDRDS